MPEQMPVVGGIDHRFVEIGDFSLHVAEAGSAEAADGQVPILLIHGWPQHWYQWRFVGVGLGESRRVIMPDLRGFGWSEIAWERLAPGDHADDLVRLLDALEVDRVHVVGHGEGGLIGSRLASVAPDRVASLTLVSTTTPFRQPNMYAISFPCLGGWLCRLHIEGNGGTKLTARRLPGYIDRQFRWRAKQRRNLDRPVRDLYALAHRPWTRIRASVALQRGILREAFGRNTAQVPAEVPVQTIDSRTVDAGHYLPEEAPELVVDRVNTFIDANRGAEASRLPVS